MAYNNGWMSIAYVSILCAYTDEKPDVSVLTSLFLAQT